MGAKHWDDMGHSVVQYSLLLSKRGNKSYLRHLLGAIELSCFRKLPSMWSVLGVVLGLYQGGRDRGVAYRFYYPLKTKSINADEAVVALTGMDVGFWSEIEHVGTTKNLETSSLDLTTIFSSFLCC